MDFVLNAPDRAEIMRYLGGAGREVPPDLSRQIDRCSEAVIRASRPKAVYKKFGPDGEGCFSGTDIKEFLRGCTEVYFMAATLGSEVERLIMKTGVENMSDALVMDACAASAVESVCDMAEDGLRRECAGRGAYLTDRFSPGYGDWPLSCQGSILELLNAGRRIGLTVSGTNILLPRKSVTAVMGVSPVPVRRRTKCGGCSMKEKCRFYMEGESCGKRTDNT